jgi:hypothetical protein
MQMDEFYARCARLTRYGLVLPLERNTNFDPSQYMFRMTILGRRLIEMLEASGLTGEVEIFISRYVSVTPLVSTW